MAAPTATDGADRPTTTDASRSTETAAPIWFEAVTILGVTSGAFVGVIGLLLAIVGHYRTWVALLLGLPLAVGAVVVHARSRTSSPATEWGRAGHLAAVAACVVAGAFTLFAGWAPSQHLLINRDPGSYAVTARWLTEEGSLEVDLDETVPESEHVRSRSAAVYQVGDDTLQFQFNHLAPVLLATADDVGGYRLLFRLPAIVTGVGLMAIYAVAVRATRRPGAALLAPLLLAVAAPVLFVSRDTYSEPFALMLLWGAALVLLHAYQRARPVIGLLGGSILGALVCTRIDTLLVVAVAIPLVVAGCMVTRDKDLFGRRVRTSLAAGAGLLVAGTVGVVDLEHRSGQYVTDLSSNINSLRVLVVLSLVLSVGLGVVWSRWSWLRRVAQRVAPAIALPAALFVVGALLFGWFVRPAVQTTRGGRSIGLVETLQRIEGDEIDGYRRYGEQTLVWMQWYLGAVGLSLAVAGLGLVVYLALRRRSNPAMLAVAALTLAAGGLYWWNARITPDQLWASRRFVPAVLPGLAIMVAVAATFGISILIRRWPTQRWIRPATGAVLVAALVAAPLAATWPIRDMRRQFGTAGVMDEACDLVGPDSLVAVAGDYARLVLPQTIRSWCGQPAVALTAGVTNGEIQDLAEWAGDNGLSMHVMSNEPSAVTPVATAFGATRRETHTTVWSKSVSSALTALPDGYRTPRLLGLSVVEIPTGP